MSEIQKIWDRKARARMAALKRLERGEVTRDELHWQNSIIPRDLAESPEWKQTVLAGVSRNFGRARPTRLTLPSAEIGKNRNEFMTSATFTAGDLEPILKIASDCGLILIGGQAVGSWATLLETPDEEPWKSSRPYTSKDADMLCGRNQMLQFARALTEDGWAIEIFEPDKNEEKINTGALRIQGMIGGKRQVVELNLLKQLEGPSNQEIEENLERIPILSSFIRTIDPLRLLESKTISLNTLDQSRRQDKSHVVLCLATLRSLLAITGNGPDWPNAVRTARRIIQNTNDQIGLDTLTRHQIHLLDAIPWEAWRQSNNPEIQDFGNEEQTQREHVEMKLKEIDELKQWIESLQPKMRPFKKPGADRPGRIG